MKLEDILHLCYARRLNITRALDECVGGVRVLYLGCGRGKRFRELESHGSEEVIGLDIMLDELAKRSAEDTDSTYVIGDGAELPFVNESFDAVFADHVVEHIPNHIDSLQEINRVLRPGGSLILHVPTVNSKSLEILYPLARGILKALTGTRRTSEQRGHGDSALIEGQYRAEMELGSYILGAAGRVQDIVSRLPTAYMRRAALAVGVILYFSIQNHEKHVQKRLYPEWRETQLRAGFKIERALPCSVAPNLVSLFPSRLFPYLKKFDGIPLARFVAQEVTFLSTKRERS